jgi:hypothetical protein
MCSLRPGWDSNRSTRQTKARDTAALADQDINLKRTPMEKRMTREEKLNKDREENLQAALKRARAERRAAKRAAAKPTEQPHQ